MRYLHRVLLLSALSCLLLGNAPPVAPGSTTAPRPYAARFAKYAVAADNEAASRAGASVLARGGNAADAAAATMLALGVASPASSGLGGGGFALYYRARDRSLTFLDFRETAPKRARADMFEKAGKGDGTSPLSAPSEYGGLASGIPGEPAGIEALVKRFGTLPLTAIVEPAVALARDGIAVSPSVAAMSGRFAAQMKRDAVMRTWFSDDAPALSPGQILKQPELAATLRTFGQKGAAAFYRGPIAAAIVRANRAQGGLITAADLRAYRVVERSPMRATRFGYDWVTAPPPSAGGFTMLQSLGLLERWLGNRMGSVDEPTLLHALAESWKGPFFDRARYFGDPDHVEVPLDRMLAGPRIEARAAAFRPTLAMPSKDYEQPLENTPNVQQAPGAGTSHLCVVDAEGNVAAVTTTVNLPFGARYTAAGFVMNDEMDDFASAVGQANAFDLPGGAANLPGPRKRPVSTMTPTIVFDREGPVLCVGASGGSRIVTATEQVALRTLLLRQNAPDAMTAPRIHHQGEPNVLHSERSHPLSAPVLDALKARGHALDTVDHVATVQMIVIERGPQRTLVAVSDPRKGGLPAGE